MPAHIRSLALCVALVAPTLTLLLPASPAWGQNNTCQFAFDGDCDEPGRGTGLCAAGTDTQDCSVRDPGPNSCQFANDGECDHPGTGTGACPPNTDQNDCGGAAGGPGNATCGFANDGECDEPGIGTGLCAAGTDTADCRS